MGLRQLFSRKSASAPVYGQGGWNYVPMLPLRKLDEKHPDAQTNPFLLGPAWQIALRLGALPIKTMQLGPEVPGGRRTRHEASDHRLAELLRAPNPKLTPNLMFGSLVFALLDRGRMGWEVVLDDRGMPAELWPIPPHMLHVKKDDRELIDRFEIGKERTPIPFERMLYFRLLPDLESFASAVAPFEVLSTLALMGTASAKRAEEVFDHGQLDRSYVDTHGDELDPKARRRLKRDFMEMRRDPLAMPVAEFGYTIESMGAGPPPELFDTGLKMAMRVIRDTLGLPEEWDERQFFGAVIGPIANAIEQELKRGLCDLYFASDLVFPEFGFREILKGDPLEVAKLHQTRILSGQETPDEARSDEDRPPIEGGDKLFVPLNVIPIEQTGGVPRETDTAGGLGGSEGRGTLEPGRAPQLSAAFVTSPAGHKAAVQRRYGELRERTLRGQATSCARALRSIVRVEERDVIGALRGSKQLTPEMRHALDMIGKHDPELERVVHQYMLQAGEKGIDAAAALINEQAADLTSQLDRAFRERAEVAADRFTVVRQERMRAIFEKAVTQSMRPGDVEAAVRKAYSSLNDYFVEGIARDGTAFGYERGAMLTWADSGVRSIDIVFGGGPCGTKVCPDAQSGSPYEIGRDLGHDVGFSYSGAEAPPLHPSCTCFAVASLG